MNSKTTWRLFIAAIALFAFIVFVERRNPEQKVSAEKNLIFQKLPANSVTGLEIQTTNIVIRAERTNDVWRLTRPFYPAQSTPIDSFVAALTALPKFDVISASEVSAQQGKLKDYGLEPPAAVFTVSQGSNRYTLQIGNLTALRDQLYAAVPGSGEVLVTDASILRALPASVNDWRSPMLLQLAGRPFDHIQIRSGQSVLEFEQDTTNHVWRISKPTPARANDQRITALLQQLSAARVKQFVTDSPTADLDRYGLQTPALELSFSLDTNRVTALEFGASPTNDPGGVYVRRVSTTNIVLASHELLDSLSLPYKAFHDPHLISSDPNQLTVVQIKGPAPFTLARQTNGLWAISEPAALPADPGLVKAFLTNLVEMTIENFAKDVPTDADLKNFGLLPPHISYALFTARTNGTGGTTNGLLTEIGFGSNTAEGLVYARRNDETPVYETPNIAYLLPSAAWQLRDRQIFDFAATNVLAIDIYSGGKTNRSVRTPQGWSPADPIRNAALEEVVLRLGQLRARNWIDKGARRMSALGFQKDGVMLEVELVPGSAAVAPPPISFGKQGVRNNVYGATVLPGDVEPTLFEFPGDLYQSVLNAFGGQ
jgi:hypothetical protein